eukprot:scaffold99356_cov19-Tisochrysis_lutea.AAC.2
MQHLLHAIQRAGPNTSSLLPSLSRCVATAAASQEGGTVAAATAPGVQAEVSVYNRAILMLKRIQCQWCLTVDAGIPLLAHQLLTLMPELRSRHINCLHFCVAGKAHQDVLCTPT